MVGRAKGQMKQVQNMEPAIVMPSVRMTSSTLTVRRISKVGSRILRTRVRTWEWAITVLAVTKWTFGKRTQCQMLTRRTHARSQACTDARARNVAITTKESDTRGCATKMVATMLLGAWVPGNFMGEALNSKSTPRRRSHR